MPRRSPRSPATTSTWCRRRSRCRARACSSSARATGVRVHTSEYERSLDECRVLDALVVRGRDGAALPITRVLPHRVEFGGGAVTLAFAGPGALTVGLADADARADARSSGRRPTARPRASELDAGCDGACGSTSRADRGVGAAASDDPPRRPRGERGALARLVRALPAGARRPAVDDRLLLVGARRQHRRAAGARRARARSCRRRSATSASGSGTRTSSRSDCGTATPSSRGSSSSSRSGSRAPTGSCPTSCTSTACSPRATTCRRATARTCAGPARAIADPVGARAAHQAAARRVGAREGARGRSRADDWAREQLAVIRRSQDWWFAASDLDGDGMPEYGHPYSSGLDDSPIFDGPLPTTAPDLGAYLVLQDLELARFAERFGDADAAAHRARAPSARSGCCSSSGTTSAGCSTRGRPVRRSRATRSSG